MNGFVENLGISFPDAVYTTLLVEIGALLKVISLNFPIRTIEI